MMTVSLPASGSDATSQPVLFGHLLTLIWGWKASSVLDTCVLSTLISKVPAPAAGTSVDDLAGNKSTKMKALHRRT